MTSLPPSSPVQKKISAIPRHVALGLAALTALLALAAAFIPLANRGLESSDDVVTRWIDPLRVDTSDVLRTAAEGDRALRSYIVLQSKEREEASYERQRSATNEALRKMRETSNMADEDTKRLALAFAERVDSWLEFADELSAKAKSDGRASALLALETGVGANRLDQASLAYEALDKRLRTIREQQLTSTTATASTRRMSAWSAIAVAILASIAAFWLAIRASRPVMVETSPLGALKLRTVLEPLSDGVVVIGRDGRPIATNTAAWRLAAASEASGPSLLLGEGEPLDSDESPTSMALRGEQVSDKVLFAEGADGTLSRVTVSAAPVTADDGSIVAAVVSMRDQSAHEQLAAELGAAQARAMGAEQALAEARSETAEALEAARLTAERASELESRAGAGEEVEGSLVHAAAAVAIAVFDAREFRLMEANEHGLRLLGERRRERDARGATLSEIVPGAESNGLASTFRQVALTGQLYENHELKLEGVRHGTAYWSCAVAPLKDKTGLVDRLMLTGTDVSELVKARQDAVSSQSAASEVESHKVEDVLVAVSNNLRTPVTSIKGMVEIFKDKYCEGIPDVTALHFLELTQRNAEQMATLVEDMAELSALGRAPLSFAEVPLAAVVEEAWQTSSRDGLELRIAGPLPIVRADRVRLARGLTDVFNVIEQLKGDSGPAYVHVRSRDLGTKWEIEISDNGRGFEPGAAESLFGPLAEFEGGSMTNGTGPVLGVGIGLAATRRIAQLHGGHAKASGEPGNGATFSVTIDK